MDIQIAKVTHYYDKIGVAVVEVINQTLQVGDRVKISGHDKEFTQVIESLQMEHSHVFKAEAGESAGIKVDQPVKADDMIYLLSHR